MTRPAFRREREEHFILYDSNTERYLYGDDDQIAGSLRKGLEMLIGWTPVFDDETILKASSIQKIYYNGVNPYSHLDDAVIMVVPVEGDQILFEFGVPIVEWLIYYE